MFFLLCANSHPSCSIFRYNYPMKVLSIDPGVERVGWAFFEKNGSKSYRYLRSGLIKTSKSLKHEDRLMLIYEALEKLVKKEKPGMLVLERLFFTRNVTTAIAVGQAQGVIMLLASAYKMDVMYLTPTQIKSIVTGSGAADKKAVQKMLRLILGLDEDVKQDDQADAIACGYAYCCLKEELMP